jgi:hypothetical protein
MSSANPMIITPADAKAAADKINNNKAHLEFELREYVKKTFVTEKNRIVKYINNNIITQISYGKSRIVFDTHIDSPHYKYDLDKYIDPLGIDRIDKTIADQLDKECKVLGEFIKAAGYPDKVTATGVRRDNLYRYDMNCEFTIGPN